MIGTLLSFIPWEWLAVAGAALAAVITAWFGGARSAKTKAENKSLKETVKSHEIRNEVENRVASEPDPRQRLRDRWGE